MTNSSSRRHCVMMNRAPKNKAPLKKALGAVSLFAVSTAMALSTDGVAFAQEAAQQIAVEAGPLDMAILELSEEAGISVFVPPALAAGKTAFAVSGLMTPEEALSRLLNGTGLDYQRNSDGSYVIVRMQASTSAPADTAAVPSRGFDTIIVTAQKREENLQDVPIAISALSQSDLTATGLEDVRDLRFHVPGLEVTTSGGVKTTVTLRGIGGDIPNVGGEAGVTVNQDGVPLISDVLFNADFLDIERIEVLRGPQGTINGRNATGGAFNIYSNRPTDELEGSVGLTFGSYDRFSTEGHLSGPLIGDKILGRIAFKTDRDDGWFKNVLTGENVGVTDLVHMRGSLLGNFSDNFEALLTIDFLRDRGTGGAPLFVPGRIRPDTQSIPEFAGVSGGNLDDLHGEYDSPFDHEKEQIGGSLRLTLDLGADATLTSITGYYSTDINANFECDGTALSVCTVSPWNFDIWQASQELTLAANLTEDFDVIIGGLFLRGDTSQRSAFFSEEYIGIGPGLLDTTVVQELTSFAAYGQMRYSILDKVRISVGARYTHDKKDYGETGFAFAVVDRSASESWDSFTPRVAIDFQPTDDLTIFASASRGFKAGGFNSFSVPINSFEPETVWSYEAGLKGVFADNRVKASTSVFYMDYNALQQNVFGLNGNIFPTILNAGQAEIKGVEVELDAYATEQLRFGFSGTYLDAEFTELNTADVIFPELGVLDTSTGLNVRDLSGNQLPKASKWQFSTFAEMRAPLTQSLIGVLRADYSWRDNYYFSIYNHEADQQEAYGLLNLRASVETEDGRWNASVFARNVLDERYFVQTEASTGIAPVPRFVASIGDPRTYGVSIGYRF